MSKLKILATSFIISFLVWSFFTAPLLKYVATGIPSSGQSFAKDDRRNMIEGDQLQLLYHYWLFADMLQGKTQWLHNPYEFNTGNDADRLAVDSYYFPFSLVFALFSYITTRAFAWNITGFLSLWLTYLATWLLVSRFTRNKTIGAVFALTSILMPVRWMNLLGGSPTGFAMMWIPIIMLGVDMAVRSRSLTGGWIAGIALLFASWTDLHVFYFSAMLLPATFIISMIMPDYTVTENDDSASVRFKRNLFNALKNLIPTAICVFIILLYVITVQRYLGKSVMKGGREIYEIAIFSQKMSGLWSFNRKAFSAWLYLGYAFLLALSVSLVYLIASLKTARNSDNILRKHITLALIIAGSLCVVFLASGPYGPFNGLLFTLARKFIPSYTMIRQPGKIFALMPTLLALCAGLGFAMATEKIKRVRPLLLTVIASFALIEYWPRVKITICMLDPDQGAYAAVASEAAAREEAAHALVLPLWPGDSHYASVYQYYASLYRIRLLNGYSPSVTQEYKDNVFKYFESINEGIITNEQLDSLINMKIRHILVHENLFPEKVSPFPVLHTLNQLFNCPRINFINRTGSVWAFQILDEPIAKSTKETPYYFPARHWLAHNFETQDDPEPILIPETQERFLRIRAGNHATTGLVLQANLPNLHWQARIRGAGTLKLSSHSNGTINETSVTLDSDNWEWVALPVKDIEEGRKMFFRLQPETGFVDIYETVLCAGNWISPEVKSSIRIPAACFFHSGYSDIETGSVYLRSDYEQRAIDFYGPKLPLAPGVYKITLQYESDAKKGTELGAFNFRTSYNETERWHHVIAGNIAEGVWESTGETMHLAFLFERAADMRIDSVKILRLK